jgi:hypothetical protein
LSPEVFQTAVRKTIGPPVALFGSLRHIGETKNKKKQKKKFRMKFPKKNKKNIGARRFISDTVHPRWICSW